MNQSSNYLPALSGGRWSMRMMLFSVSVVLLFSSRIGQDSFSLRSFPDVVLLFPLRDEKQMNGKVGSFFFSSFRAYHFLFFLYGPRSLSPPLSLSLSLSLFVSFCPFLSLSWLSGLSGLSGCVSFFSVFRDEEDDPLIA